MQKSQTNSSASQENTDDSDNSLANVQGESMAPELNITQWRQIMSDSARRILSGELSAVNSNALANLMGQTTRSYKLQLEYAKAVGRVPEITALMPEIAIGPSKSAE